MFAPKERAQWQRSGCNWRRRPWHSKGRAVRLAVRPSGIPGAGMGLFWVDLKVGEDGQRLGRFSGKVAFASDSRDAAEDWALARGDDRLVLLRLDGRSVVVDARGSVFEYANCAVCEASANMHVHEDTGVVELCDNVLHGDELLWWYGELHAASRA